MLGPAILKTLFAAINKIAPCDCYLLNDEDSLPKVPVTDGVVGISFIDDNISEFILKLRISPHLPDKTKKLPVIFLGFRSLRSLIKSEQYPKLMSSQGIYYLRLPASVEDIKITLDVASKCEITDPKGTVKELLLSAEEMTSEESSIVHTLGNFLGSERLLYGACFAGRLNGESALDIMVDITKDQKILSGEKEFYYEVYRLKQDHYEDKLLNCLDLNQMSGLNYNILFIDDLAHLGWSKAIAHSIWGKDISLIKDDDLDALRIQIIGGRNKLTALSKRPDSKETVFTEDQFIEALKIHLDKFITDKTDIVLLDLRLRRTEDEKINDAQEASGISIMRRIREINAAIPVLILTASRRARNMEKIYDHGADAYFVKEMGRATDTPEMAKDYYHKFIDILNYLGEKAYLGEAWRIVQYIIDNNKFTDIEEVNYLKKAIALLKKKPLPFEQDVLGYDVLGEAVVCLNSIREIRTRSLSIRDSLDGGYLLGGLRNFVTHASGVKLEDDDVRSALYLTFRLFINDNDLLKPLALRVFENKKRLHSRVLMETYSKLANLLNIPFIDALRIKLKDLISDGYTYETLKGNKLNHYLLFLCRTKHRDMSQQISHYDKYIEADQIVVSHFLKKLDQVAGISTKFSGTVEDVKVTEGLINIDISSDQAFFHVSDLDGSLRNNIKVSDNVSFDLTLDEKQRLWAINLRKT